MGPYDIAGPHRNKYDADAGSRYVLKLQWLMVDVLCYCKVNIV